MTNGHREPSCMYIYRERERERKRGDPNERRILEKSEFQPQQSIIRSGYGLLKSSEGSEKTWRQVVPSPLADVFSETERPPQQVFLLKD